MPAPTLTASYVLGRKLDSIPFSAYHMLVIAVLALVGFIEGYDLVITGSLLVLAKEPLHLTGSDIRWLAVGPTFMLCLGGFASSAVSDHWSRKTVMLIGVIATTFFTLLIPLVQNAEQLIILRLLTGLSAGGAVSAAFPIAAELMPAQHRRTYGAVYEMALAAAFTLVPFLAFLLAGNPNAFRLAGTTGRAGDNRRASAGLFRDSRKPALAFGPRPAADGGRHRQPDHQAVRRPRAAADGRCARRSPGCRPRETAAVLGIVRVSGQLRWTVVGILAGICAGTAYFLISVLLPKALVDQGAAVTSEFRTQFAGVLREHTGQGLHRVSDGDHRPPLDDRLCACRIASRHIPDVDGAPGGDPYATVVMVTGALITGFTVLSAFTATRVYLSEQFPTSLRGRGHIFGESFGRLFAGVLAPFLMEPYTASPTIFFGTILVVVAIGAFIPLAFGRETVGQLETVTEEIRVPA